ncbi:MAG: DUF1553 domain-containing protein [Pirellulaceae bacterium]
MGPLFNGVSILPRPSYAARGMIALWGILLVGTAAAETPVGYATQVRPILAQHCYPCHGPDAGTRQAELRLDLASDHSSVITRGNLAESELYQRLVASDPEVRMPPPEADTRPSLAEIALLRTWIEQGAATSGHWAFQPIERSPGTIDRHVTDQLSQQEKQLAPPADSATWLRRVTFDLTGLPPTPEELAEFISEDSPLAREQAVDRLLASPAYGEQMARGWLDLARYADTHGYNIDSHREMWRYREWVIEALNANMPLDQFTIEQLAGDLLPGATTEQITATGFLRSHPVNDEMGAIAAEYQHAYVVDRVNTTATTWLGLTFSCAQCHDHKFDPISQREYYRLAAMFDNFAERGLDGRRGNAVPVLASPTFEQRRESQVIEARLAEIDSTLANMRSHAQAGLPTWIDQQSSQSAAVALPSDSLWIDAPLDGPGDALANKAGTEGKLELRPETARFIPGRVDDSLLLDGRTYLRLAELPDPRDTLGLTFSASIYPTTKDSAVLLAHVPGERPQLEVVVEAGRLWVLYQTSAGTRFLLASEDPFPTLHQWQHLAVVLRPTESPAVAVLLGGQPLALVEETQPPHLLADDPLNPRPFPGRGTFIAGLPEAPGLRGMLDEVRLYTEPLTGEAVARLAGENRLAELLDLPEEKRTAAQTERLVTWMLEETSSPYVELQSQRATWQRRLDRLRQTYPETMVVAEQVEPRETHLRIGGQYDRLGEVVTPAAPTSLFAENFGQPANRLELARWLVHPQNPLTARVLANRIWTHHFGVGLVKTVDDFGIRGEIPRHAKLLDCLAAELIDSGWNRKHLHRLIVTSSTYAQTSQVGRAAYLADPENRHLARGPRLRRDAEEIRDAALASSGLLVRHQGGRSVRPYQVEGLWEEIAYGADYTAQSYVQDEGSQLYRRGLYTYWKRSSPPPALATFDAPNRENCVAQRGRSNTPQQALVLLNDPTFVEAARVMAADLNEKHPRDLTQQIDEAFIRLTAQSPTPQQLEALSELYHRQHAIFTENHQRRDAFLSIGETSPPPESVVTEVAALAVVCQTVMNLDQALTTD